MGPHRLPRRHASKRRGLHYPLLVVGLLVIAYATWSNKDLITSHKYENPILHKTAAASAISRTDAHAIPDACQLSTIVQSWKAKVKDIVQSPQMQPVIELPTPKKPLVFFHVRKAGGTGTRKLLHLASARGGVPDWMVCFDHLPCDTYYLPVASGKFAVFGGHLTYNNVVNQLGFERAGGSIQQVVTDKPFDCLVSLRSTVSRVVSCWNFRFGGQDGTMPNFVPAHNVSVEQWERDLPRLYSRHREGCNNELVRVFGTNNDESWVNTYPLDNLETCTAAVDLGRILSRLSQCVITVQDRCKDNKAVISHYIPWLAESWDECKGAYMEGHIRSTSLQPGAREAILRQNRMDEYIYQYGLALYEEQLRTARASGH